MANRSDNPAGLEDDVALRRRRLERDLQELQAKLSPGQLLDEGMTYLRRSQGADFFRNLGTSMRDKPLPVALVGVGLTWLAASGAGPNGRARPATTTTPSNEPSMLERAWEAGRSVMRTAGETQTQYSERVTRARAQALGLTQSASETADAYRERVEEAMYTARDKLRAARDRVADAASDSYDRVTGAASQGYAQAQDYAGRAGESAHRAVGTVSRTGSDMARAIGDNPVLLGAVGMVAGALLGALIPRSRTEEEMLRPIANTAADTARSVASQAMEQGERVARAAMDAGVEVTQKTTDAVRQAAEDVRDGAAGNAAGGPPGNAQRPAAEISPLRREPPVSRPAPSRPAVPERERERQAAGAAPTQGPVPGTQRAGETGTSPMIG